MIEGKSNVNEKVFSFPFEWFSKANFKETNHGPNSWGFWIELVGLCDFKMVAK